MTNRTLRFDPMFDKFPYEYVWTVGYERGYYKTNPNGEGIFYVNEKYEERQLVGTCQFSVRGLLRETGKARIRRWTKKSLMWDLIEKGEN